MRDFFGCRLAAQLALDLMADSAQNMLEAFISVNGSDDANNLLIARRDVESGVVRVWIARAAAAVRACLLIKLGGEEERE